MTFRIDQLNLSISNTIICNALDIEIKPGEFWAVLGVNGVGKSTLLHHIIDVNSVGAEQITIDDKCLVEYKHHRKNLAKKCGILLQEYEYHFTCNVLDAALIGRHPYLTEWQWESADDIQKTENALKATRLLDFKERLTNSLSGGEKRRLNIATLLTQDPKYLLLDEPTNHLDLGSQIEILKLLQTYIKNHQKSGLMVIHDANLANRFCDKILMLFGDGEWAAGSTNELMNKSNLSRLYRCTIQEVSNEEQTLFIAR